MKTLATAVALGTAVIATAASAAEPDGGVKLSFGVSTTARYNDNYNLVPNPSGDTSELVTTLSFGVTSTTRTQSAGLSGSIGAQALHTSGQDTQIGSSNPNLSAFYTADGPSSDVKVTLGWSRNDQTLTETGTQSSADTSTAGVKFTLGRDRRLGADFAANYSKVDYANSGSSDSRTSTLKAGVRLDATPALSLRTSGSIRHYVRDNPDPLQTDTTEATLGADLKLNGTDTLSAGVSQNRIAVKDGATVTGNTGSLQFSHEGRTVTTSLFLSSSLSLQGTRTTAKVERRHDLSDATLLYGLGVTHGATGTTLGIANLTWIQELRATSYAISLNRAVNTDADGNETLNNSFSANLGRDLNETTKANAKLAYTSRDQRGGNSYSSGTAGVSLGFALGRDWELTLGAEHRRVIDTLDQEAQSNAVYMTIGRTWVTYR